MQPGAKVGTSITLNNNNLVSNTGAISVSAAGVAVSGGTSNSFVNNGTIGGGGGMQAGASSTLINNGAISIATSDVFGMAETNDFNTLINNGTSSGGNSVVGRPQVHATPFYHTSPSARLAIMGIVTPTTPGLGCMEPRLHPDLQWTLGHVKFWHPHRILGRFDTWRRAHRGWRRAVGGFLPQPGWAQPTTIFGTLSTSDVAENLKRRGYHAGLQLPAEIVRELHRHACATPCRREPNDPERFLIDKVRDGRSPLGKPVAIADVDPAVPCPAIERCAGDATLVGVVKRFLGYHPRRVAARLYWSPVSSLPAEDRRWGGQTIDYHYDIERGNGLYVYFYLTGTDRWSGAHVLVEGSHRAKPLGMKLASTRQPELSVIGRFGAHKVVVLEGAAGFGFLEEPSCFHKALPPQRSDRLMLQFRYG